MDSGVVGMRSAAGWPGAGQPRATPRPAPTRGCITCVPLRSSRGYLGDVGRRRNLLQPPKLGGRVPAQPDSTSKEFCPYSAADCLNWRVEAAGRFRAQLVQRLVCRVFIECISRCKPKALSNGSRRRALEGNNAPQAAPGSATSTPPHRCLAPAARPCSPSVPSCAHPLCHPRVCTAVTQKRGQEIALGTKGELVSIRSPVWVVVQVCEVRFKRGTAMDAGLRTAGR